MFTRKVLLTNLINKHALFVVLRQCDDEAVFGRIFLFSVFASYLVVGVLEELLRFFITHVLLSDLQIEASKLVTEEMSSKIFECSIGNRLWYMACPKHLKLGLGVIWLIGIKVDGKVNAHLP